MEISLKNNQNYYIQRVERHYDEFNEGRKGLDYYVTFDYMGSSEFEWGALPKSWKFMKENADQYKLTTIPMVLGGNEYNVFCVIPKDTEDQYMIDLFEGFYNYTKRTKERTDVSYIDEMVSRESYQLGWFNIINDYTRDEIPWFATISPSVAYYWYKEMHNNEEIEQKHKEMFDDARIGDMVIYPTYNKRIYDIGKVVGVDDESVVVKNYKHKRRYKHNQVIFLEEGKVLPEFDWDIR